jgi:asparaginyl-tRNA synthetase
MAAAFHPMSEFADMIPPETYDRRNVPPAILTGRMNAGNVRHRLQLLNRLFSCLEGAARVHCARRGYSPVRVPNIVSTIGACENWRTLFKVDHASSYFHLLTQTGQLFLEGALTATDRVWCLTKSFRKESLEDHRHLCEFHLLEIEGAFDFEGLLEEIRGLYCALLDAVRQWEDTSTKVALGIEDAFLDHQLSRGLLQRTYTECIEALDGLRWGDDLTPELEGELLKHFGDGQTPLLVTHFPAAIKFFNMRMEDGDGRIVRSVDLLLPHSGEALGGAEREDDPARLEARLRASDMFRHHLAAGGSYNDFKPYVTLIAEGLTPRHSGCGIGMERIMQSLMRQEDIRLCSIDHLTKVLYAWDALNLGVPRKG